MNDVLAEVKIYLRMLWGHHWLAFICAVITCFIGWAIVAVLPNTYRVKATVQVERSSLLQTLLKDLAVESDLGKGMAPLMRQTMLARPNLELTARESGLAKGTDTPENFDRLLDRMAAKIDIVVSPDQAGVYTVTYEHSDPQVTQRVVQVLLDRFLDTILTVTRTDLKNTKRFIDKQLEEYRRSMEAAERRIQEFKEKHPEIPEDGRTYFSRLEETKNHYQTALLELQEAENEVMAIKALPGPRGEIIPSELDLRIQELENTLTDLPLKYTDKHPDVIAAKRALQELKAIKSLELEPGKRAISRKGRMPSLDPAYQSAKVQLTQAEAKAAALRSRAEEYKRRVALLQQNISTIPEVEAEIQKLRREYAFQQQNYQALALRREAANISDKVEHANDLKFNVLEPPQVPQRPVSPKRIILNTIVFVVGIGGGIGLVLLLLQIQPVIYSRRNLMNIADLPVLGTLSLADARKPNRSFFVANLSFFLALTALSLSFVGLNVMYFLQVESLAKLAGFGLFLQTN
ncbi:MAG: XrtA system polysaccharide chain length determinant [Pyrinomonadaceae bacterium]